jgi:phosphoenolpyruvate phosphomutase
MILGGVNVLQKASILRNLLAQPGIVKVTGVNDGLSARLSEINGFQALWASGLAISTSYGVPDQSILTMTELLQASSIINQASSLPVIADCDAGFGNVDNVARMVRLYEQAGIAGVCIEDKRHPKRNSFLEGHELETIEAFRKKIEAAKTNRDNPNFILIARIEAFIAGKGLEETFERAAAYADAGADMLLIHSKRVDAQEIIAFAERWNTTSYDTPLVAVPTTYYSITASELDSLGYKMVIYANQAIRAVLQAANQVFAKIYHSDSSTSVENEIASVKDILQLASNTAFESSSERDSVAQHN